MSSADTIAAANDIEVSMDQGGSPNQDKSKSDNSTGTAGGMIVKGLSRLVSHKNVKDKEQINISSLPQILRDKLAHFDKDGDGTIDEEELSGMMETFFRSQEMKTVYRNLLIALFVVMVLLCVFLSVMTYYVVETSKDTKMSYDVITNKDTGNPVQCANSDFQTNKDGILVSRTRIERYGRHLLSESEASAVTEALGVRNHMQSVKLSSTLPDRFFEELVWFKISSNTGLQLSFRVQAVTRLLAKAAKCGTYLKIVTSAGIVILDDNDVYYSDDLFGLFQESGFNVITSAPKNKITGRKLQSASSSLSFTITGFFNSITDYDWKCESVAKPNLPEKYSLVSKTLHQCDNADVSQSKCFFEPYPGTFIEQFGVVAVNGVKYFESKRDMYVDEVAGHIVDHLSYRPGVTSVTSVFPGSGQNKSALLRYQIENDGKLSHCERTEDIPEMKMSLPDDFIFYPIDDAGDKLMHYRISYQVEIPEEFIGFEKSDPIQDGHKWVHVDYFEDRVTKAPKMMIDDSGDILYVEEMRTSFTPFPDVDKVEFEKCLTVTNIWRENRFEKQRANFTSNEFSNVESANLSRSELAALRSWDWNLAYPPMDRGSNVFSKWEFDYYYKLQTADGRALSWLAWAESVYDTVSLNSRTRSIPIENIVDPEPEPEPAIVRSLAIINNQSLQQQNSNNHDLYGVDKARGRGLAAFEFSWDPYTPQFGIGLGIQSGIFSFGFGLSIDFSGGGLKIVGSATGCVYVVFCLEGTIWIQLKDISVTDDEPFPVGGGIDVAVDLTEILPDSTKNYKGVYAWLRYVVGSLEYEPVRGAVLPGYSTVTWSTGTGSSSPSGYTRTWVPELRIYERLPHRHAITARLNLPFPGPVQVILRGAVTFELSIPEKKSRNLCSVRDGSAAGTFTTPKPCRPLTSAELTNACKFRHDKPGSLAQFFINSNCVNWGGLPSMLNNKLKQVLPDKKSNTDPSTWSTGIGKFKVEYYKFWDWPWKWGWITSYEKTYYEGTFKF